MSENVDAMERTEAEYLRLRCGILDQVDRDMFGTGMPAGAACGRADEAFGAARDVWRWSVLLGVLGCRDREALGRWADESAAVRRWMESEEYATLPARVREWVERDWRQG